MSRDTPISRRALASSIRDPMIRTLYGTATTLRVLRTSLVCLSMVVGLGMHTAAMAQQTRSRAPLVFDGITVIDVVRGRTLPHQRVVIMGNRIVAMGSGKDVPLPHGAQVVPAIGKYLIPGLWDLHMHPMHSADLVYPTLIATGITGIRDAGSDVSLDTLRQWRREILAGTRVGPPRQLFSGHSIAGPVSTCERSKIDWGPQTCVRDSTDMRHLVDSLKAAGADMIKMRAVSYQMYFVGAAEARRIGIPFGGHIDGSVVWLGGRAISPIEASDSGASIVDHMNLNNVKDVWGQCWASEPTASLAGCQEIADHFTRNGTWFVPTLAYYHIAFADSLGPVTTAIYTRLKQGTQAFWNGTPFSSTWLHDSMHTINPGDATSAPRADTLGNMRLMQRVGLPILAGTDAGGNDMRSQFLTGFVLQAELAMYQASGMTPLAVLQTTTLNPAKFLHATDSLGTVGVGKLADLVVLDANPLTDISNITQVRAVVANGRYYDRAALDQLLTTLQAQGKTDLRLAVH